MRFVNTPAPPIIAATAVMIGLFACTARPDNRDIRTRSASSSLQPEEVEGNPTCADLGHGTLSVKDEDALNGTFSLGADGSVTVAKANGTTFDWSATIGIDAVIVKGGPKANVYVYDPEAMTDSGLHAPINPNTDEPYGLSHIDFCWDEDDTSSSSSTSSTGGSTSSTSSSSTSSSSTSSTGGSSTSSTSGSSGKTW